MKKLIFTLIAIASIIISGGMNSFAASPGYFSIEGPLEVKAGQNYTYSYYLRSIPATTTYSLTLNNNLNLFQYDQNIFDLVSVDSNVGVVIDQTTKAFSTNSKTVVVPYNDPFVNVVLKVKSDAKDQTTTIGEIGSDGNLLIPNVKVISSDITTEVDTKDTTAADLTKTDDSMITTAFIMLGLVIVALLATIAFALLKKK